MYLFYFIYILIVYKKNDWHQGAGKCWVNRRASNNHQKPQIIYVHNKHLLYVFTNRKSFKINVLLSFSPLIVRCYVSLYHTSASTSKPLSNNLSNGKKSSPIIIIHIYTIYILCFHRTDIWHVVYPKKIIIILVL